MNEPYRTLLGHFRHEVGHYFWDIFVHDGGKLEARRAIFGDDRVVDYDVALERHYTTGAPPHRQIALRICLCHEAPLGRLRGNLGALSPHRRYLGNGRR